MRLDHIAYRVSNRRETAQFIKQTFGYVVGTEFDIEFDDGSTAECIVMTPPERTRRRPSPPSKDRPVRLSHMDPPWVLFSPSHDTNYHLAPEIFISDGSKGSIVGDWVEARNGGGVHHMAYSVKNINEIVKKWKDIDVEFLTEEVIDCPEDDLKQIFTKPLNVMGGIIVELIERGHKGFCQNSVKHLMESTRELG
jgi:4-hydroxyphenylpyruvate dioxygenase-like putative hemolysin